MIMAFDTFILFAITTFVVVSVPGPAAITIASLGSSNGVLRAQFGIFGVATANALYFALSALGIASVIIASSFLFTTIKWIGVAYLTYLGFTAIFSLAGITAIQGAKPVKNGVLFSKGFLVEISNPKALLYFAAILPTFIDIELPVGPQILIMGTTTMVMDILIYSAYAFMGRTITTIGLRPWALKCINITAGGALLYAAFRMSKLPL